MYETQYVVGEEVQAKENEMGGGGVLQVFLFFVEGFPLLPLRMKIINTFAVAMPTYNFFLCAQLGSIPGHNYP